MTRFQNRAEAEEFAKTVDCGKVVERQVRKNGERGRAKKGVEYEMVTVFDVVGRRGRKKKENTTEAVA